MGAVLAIPYNRREIEENILAHQKPFLDLIESLAVLRVTVFIAENRACPLKM